jgi:beta-glucosidase
MVSLENGSQAEFSTGPVASPLGRTPYGGRLPEGFTPDPYLSGVIMAKTITGMNNAGVVTVGRHFLMNEQETNRTLGTHYSSNADDKTIHELYLWPFADAVHAGMGAVMCAMNRVNSTLSCENDKLINGLLKTELGFPGFVLPDVNSQSTAFGSANAGLDFGSSTYWTASVLEAGIANGSFSEARLDDMTVRNTIGYFYAGLDDGKQPEVAATTEYRDVRADHAKLIRKIGADSLALLKNNNTAGAGLPLDRPRTISIFGAHAGPSMAGPNFAFSVVGTDSDVYQGHLASAVGSGGLSNSYLATPFQALSLRAAQDGSMFRWIMNDTYTESSSSSSFGGSSMGGMGDMAGNSTESQGGPPDAASSSANASMSAYASGAAAGGGGAGVMGSGTTVSPSIANYAADSEVCLVFLNSWSGEGADRSELYNQDQDNLVKSVAENCNNTIVVINTSGPRLLDQWIENDNVTAVVYGGYLGQESGNAIVDVLYGDVNPNGKLSYTIAKNDTDYLSICNTAECNFDEKTGIDYRGFDANNVSVRYPFGHGLSYTTFEYGNVSAVKTDEAALALKYPSGVLSLGGAKDLFDDVISIHFTLKNTGDVDGAEVTQLYVQYPSGAQQPVRQLRGFEKVALSAGQQKDISISIRRRDVSFWDTVAQKWALASGTYVFSVGSSSRDLRASTQMSVLWGSRLLNSLDAIAPIQQHRS